MDDDLGSVVARYKPKVYAVTKQILGYATNAGTGMLKFLVSLMVSGVLDGLCLTGSRRGKSHRSAHVWT